MTRSLLRAVVVGLAVCTAALLGTGPAAQAQSTPPAPVGENPLQAPPQERVAALIRPAIVSIQEKFTAYVIYAPTEAPYNNGQSYEIDATCTGFGVSPDGYIATAGHCVDVTGPTGIKSEFIARVAAQAHAADPTIDVQSFIAACLANCVVEGQQKGSPPDAQISVVGGATANGSTQARPARVVDFRAAEQGDVALLKIEATDQPVIELAGDAQTQIGTPVLAIGYQGDITRVTDPSLEPTYNDGKISSKTTVGSVPVAEMSAALSPGMSGGPTTDLSGRVLGLNSFTIAGRTQSFNFIAPAGGLSELLNRNGVQHQLGPNDLTYRQGLADYFSGHYTSAIAGFDKLLAVSPNQAQALQYKTLAAKARDQFGDVAPPPSQAGPGLLLWVLIGVAIALVLAAVVTVLVLRGRRRSRRAERAGPPASYGPAAPPYEYGPVPAGTGPPADLAALNTAGTATSPPGNTQVTGKAPGAAPHDQAPGSAPPTLTGNAEPAAASALGKSPTARLNQPASTPEGTNLTTAAGFCPTCGTPQTSSANFCPTCGTQHH